MSLPNPFETFRQRRFLAKLRRADLLSEAGEFDRARELYVHVVAQAERDWGPDHLVTLTAREDLALTYQETPARAIELLEQLLPCFERTAGADDQRTLALRLNVAGLVGESGDHAQARKLTARLLADCERVLGSNDEMTVSVRENLAHAESEVAQAELSSLLDTSRDSLAEEAVPADWAERLARCTAGIQQTRSYRARRIEETRNSQGQRSTTVWSLAYLRPTSFHVVREASYESLDESEEVADEWITLDNDRYRNVDLWYREQEPLGDEDSQNRDLLADNYVGLLRDGRPKSVTVRRGEPATFLIAEYASAPDAFLSSIEPPFSVSASRAALWIDLADAKLKKAEGSIEGSDEQNERFWTEFRHGFTSVDAEISIAAPEVGLLFGAESAAESQ